MKKPKATKPKADKFGVHIPLCRIKDAQLTYGGDRIIFTLATKRRADQPDEIIFSRYGDGTKVVYSIIVNNQRLATDSSRRMARVFSDALKLYELWNLIDTGEIKERAKWLYDQYILGKDYHDKTDSDWDNELMAFLEANGIPFHYGVTKGYDIEEEQVLKVINIKKGRQTLRVNHDAHGFICSELDLYDASFTVASQLIKQWYEKNNKNGRTKRNR